MQGKRGMYILFLDESGDHNLKGKIYGAWFGHFAQKETGGARMTQSPPKTYICNILSIMSIVKYFLMYFAMTDKWPPLEIKVE